MRGHTTSGRISQPIMAMAEQEDSNSMANLRQLARPNKGTRGPTLLEEQSGIDPHRPQPVQAPSGRVPVVQETIQEDEDLNIQLGELLAHIARAYLIATSISQGVEPLTYRQAVESPNSMQWKEAMEREMSSLKDNNTWDLVDLPPGQTALRGRWVFKIKWDTHGTITKHKARWVVKGFEQHFGIDYNQMYAAVIKPMPYKVLFALAAFYDLHIEQMDVIMAFLHGELSKVIYMVQPLGFEDEDWAKVCQLNKALYGLKQ